jgi:pilus assembly protein CpaB
MRPKSLLLLVLALGCGLVASIGISQVMDRKGKTVALETVPIYVALHNINLGDPIDAKMLSLEEWPKDKAPRGAISDLKDLEGRRPRTAIIEGEPILEGKLLAQGEVADPIRQIPKGYRLKTIAVDAEKSAAGLLGPGDRVDVSLFVRKDERSGIDSSRTKVILQNIRVFAVDQTVQRAPDGSEERTIAKTVSLLLKPDQASKLSLAENLGEVSLIPRNPDDEESEVASEYSADDLLADGDTGSREKEQAHEVRPAATSPPATEGLLAAVQAVPSKPNFLMEIVEAHDVRVMEFDPETGKPLRNPESGPAAGPSVKLPAAVSIDANDKNDSAAQPKSDAEKMLDDFPIDFDGKL